MSNAYLYVFSPDAVDRTELGKYLDTIDGVEDWFTSIPNTMFVIGTVPARRLSKLFVEKFGQHRHFITLVSKTGRAGWMLKDHWGHFPKDEG